jgi:hypothetical protein
MQVSQTYEDFDSDRNSLTKPSCRYSFSSDVSMSVASLDNHVLIAVFDSIELKLTITAT